MTVSGEKKGFEFYFLVFCLAGRLDFADKGKNKGDKGGRHERGLSAHESSCDD
jgi:hypothetical protein